MILMGMLSAGQAWGCEKPQTEVEYDYMGCFSQDDLVEVRKNGKWGVVDKFGKVVVPVEYAMVNELGDGFVSVTMIKPSASKNEYGKWGIVDRDGKLITPLHYDVIWTFQEDLAGARKGTQWGFINKKGEVVIDFQYDGAGSFQEGLVAVEQGNQMGFINKKGEVVIPFQFQYAYPSGFKNGVSLVKKNGKYGFIDKTGKEVIPIKYDYAYYYDDDITVVLNGEFIEFDHQGNMIDRYFLK